MYFLRTTHVVSPAGYGMGYRPPSRRNVAAFCGLPPLSRLLASLNSSKSSNDDLTGLKPYYGKFFDQTQTGSCTAQSSCKASRITLVANGSMPPGVDDFSQRVFYGGTREIERAAATAVGSQLLALQDIGADPMDCITCAQTVGVAPMGPTVSGVYDDVDASNVNVETDLGDFERTSLEPGAHNVDITATDLIDQWRAQVAAKIGGTIALFVDTQNFMAYDGSAPIQKIDLGDPNGGGHQITGPVYHYTSSALGVVVGFGNSWGAWGMGGYGEITLTCLMQAIDNAIAWNTRLLTQAVVP